MRGRYLFRLVALGTTLLPAACGQERGRASSSAAAHETAPAVAQERGSRVSLLRVVSAVPSEPATDVLVGSAVAFTKIVYGDVTPYQMVSSGALSVGIRPSVPEASTPIGETTVRLGAGKHYTLLATPAEAGGATLSLLVDEVAPPAEGKAAIRVVNASPEPGSVDVEMRGATRPLVSGEARSRASAFVDVAPRGGTLEVRSAGALRAHVSAAELRPGNRYTILLLKSSRQAPLTARLIGEPAVSWPVS